MYIARDKDESLVIFSEMPVRITDTSEDGETVEYWGLEKNSEGYGFEIESMFENVPEEIRELTFDDDPIEI